MLRAERWEKTSNRGATIWFTGLSGSGKSTVAVAVQQKLIEIGRVSYLLDGDNLRMGLNGDLGFSAEDRSENIRRVGEVARLFADAGVVALVPVLSPYRVDRGLARETHVRARLDSHEVFVDAPLDVCEARDPKGLYVKARAGEIKGFTGIDDPYESPLSPELIVKTAETAVEDASALILGLLTS